jgi:hypothetical protein
MSSVPKRLLMVGGGEAAAPQILDALRRSYDIQVIDGDRLLSVPPIDGAGCAALIRAGDDPGADIRLAARIKRAHPGLVVILMGLPPVPGAFEAAFRAGVDAVVDAGDAAAVEYALASRLSA